MGSGGSRLKGPESIPAKFRPILRRRIEEVRRRRRLRSTKDELAKKELIVANDVSERKSNVGKGEESLERCVVLSEERDGGGRMSDTRLSDLDGDTDIDDDDVVDEASIFYPGSPSFRIYFVDHSDDSHDDGDNHSLDTVKEEEVVEEKIHGGNASPEKDLGRKPILKKVQKKRSLKNVIPRGGQAAVKNLLNVKSCYTPTHHGRAAHPLSEKPQPN